MKSLIFVGKFELNVIVLVLFKILGAGDIEDISCTFPRLNIVKFLVFYFALAMAVYHVLVV